jgi:hypothetical protein
MIKLQDLIREDFKTKMKKFIESGVDADIVGDYIKKFKKIRDAKFKVALDGEIKGFHINGKDRFNIDKYKTFKELEVFVDYVDGQVKLSNSKGKTFTDIDVSGEALGKKNGLEIYYAKDREACVKYRGKIPYGWCVARSDSSNMYNTYRYAGNEPSFYFVKDVAATKEELRKPFDPEKGFTNKWHFFVIQKTGTGYIVSSANNDGDVAMSWDEILKIEPKLEGMEKYFQHVPLSDKEREVYTRFKNGIPFNEFVKLSYEDKESYLDIAGVKRITFEFFAVLPRDLKNKYIGFGLGLDKDEVAEIYNDPKLMQWMNQKSFERHKSRVDGEPFPFLFSDEYYYENNEEKFKELMGGTDAMSWPIFGYIDNNIKDPDKYIDKIIKFKGKDLSDTNINQILYAVKDKDKYIDWAINVKGNDLSDSNIESMLRHAKDKDKYIDWVINVKGNDLSDSNIGDILRHAKDKDKYIDKIIKFKSNYLSNSNIEIMLRRAIDKDKYIDWVIKFKSNYLSDSNIEDILLRAIDKDKYVDYFIKFKGKDLSDSNIGDILYSAIDKEKYVDYFIKFKGKDLSPYVSNLISKYQNNFPSKLTQENISTFKDFF